MEIAYYGWKNEEAGNYDNEIFVKSSNTASSEGQFNQQGRTVAH